MFAEVYKAGRCLRPELYGFATKPKVLAHSGNDLYRIPRHRFCFVLAFPEIRRLSANRCPIWFRLPGVFIKLRFTKLPPTSGPSSAPSAPRRRTQGKTVTDKPERWQLGTPRGTGSESRESGNLKGQDHDCEKLLEAPGGIAFSTRVVS